LVLSVGAAAWGQGRSVDEIMDEADREMYVAKARGKEDRLSA
jgi:GGDEF domain-containing protein